MLTLAVQAVRDVFDKTGGRKVCFYWIDEKFKLQGVTQHHLRQMAAQGMLQPEDVVRAGKRRYYLATNHPVWTAK